MVPSSTDLRLSTLFLVSTFDFLVALNKRKNNSMGNCISKINKDHFFVREELMKNYIFFSKGKKRRRLHMGTRGNICGVPFHDKVFRNNDVGPVTNWGVVGRSLRKNGTISFYDGGYRP